LRDEWVIVLVSDIRNYTPMNTSLPGEMFSRFIKDWFGVCTGIIEGKGGSIDRFLGDAVMAFWVAANRENAQKEISDALEVAGSLIDEAHVFSTRLSGDFPGYEFRIGVGLSMGSALLANAEHGETDLAGASVDLAFRLESLTKEKKYPVIVGANIAGSAGEAFRFRDLGQATIEGWQQPVSICALLLD